MGVGTSAPGVAPLGSSGSAKGSWPLPPGCLVPLSVLDLFLGREGVLSEPPVQHSHYVVQPRSRSHLLLVAWGWEHGGGWGTPGLEELSPQEPRWEHFTLPMPTLTSDK